MANTELASVERCRVPWGAGLLNEADSNWGFCGQMCRPRTALGACAVKDKIYAVGGQACPCHPMTGRMDPSVKLPALMNHEAPCMP